MNSQTLGVTKVGLRAALLGSAFLFAGAPLAAMAQTASADSGTVEEVVVTAQKRSENLQNVPVAVSVVSGDSLKSQGVQTTLDLDQIVPGLNMTKAVGLDELPFIRGLGSNEQGSGVESPVATYVDGVYIYSQASTSVNLKDIEQISVLKGPQGTLFGRNATGGLIQYTTKAPSHTTAMDLDATVGNVGEAGVSFYGTTGLTSTVAVGLAASYDDQSQGFGKNLYNGEWVYTHRSQAVRGKLLWQPDSKTDVTLESDYNEYDAAEPVNRIDGTRTVLGTPMPGGPWNTDLDLQPHVGVEGGGDDLTIKRDLGFAQLVSITAYRFDRLQSQFDADGTTQAYEELRSEGDDETWSQEVQLVSPNEGRFTWVAGMFSMGAHSGSIGYNCGSFFIAGPPGTPASPCYPAQASHASSGYSYSQTINDLFTIAGFAQGTFKIDDATNLTGGFRYSSDTRTGMQYSFTGAPIAGVSGVGGAAANQPGTATGPLGTRYVSADPAALHFADPSYRISLDHRFSPEVMAYLSFNHGFRSGEFGNFGSVASNTAATPVQPEMVDALETGIKADLFDRHLRIDAAAYYYQDHDHIYRQIVNGTSEELQAKLATMYGLDLDAIWRFNDALSFRVGLAAERAYYNSFGNASCTGYPQTGQYISGCGVTTTPTAFTSPTSLLPQNNYTITFGNDSGHTVEDTPDFTLSLAPTYVLPTSIGQFRSTVTYYYNDGWYGSASNYSKWPGYSTVAAEILYVPSWSKNLSLRFWGANLTNTNYADQLTETTPGPNYQVAPGRTYGVTLELNY